MTLAYLLLLTGLTISAVAIYYSVVGLTAIFSAAAIPIIVMGSALEVAKLVCATWLKANWTKAPVLLKTYMSSAVVVLMIITSMGIFGFLSKAHSDQSLVSGDVLSRISVYDEKIKTAKDNVDANRKALKQMDEAVDQVMGRSTSETGADKAVAIRKSQQKERSRLQSEIAAEQKVIAQINEERAPIAAEVRKVEAEVGPIKYIAAFIYGDTNESVLEKAVTWVIIMIVVVFDPLAVIMLLAAQMTFAWLREEKETTVVEQPVIQQEVISIPQEDPVIVHEPISGDASNASRFGFDETAVVEPVAEESDLDKWNAMIAEAEKEVGKLVEDHALQDRIARGETYIDSQGEEAEAEYEADDGPLTEDQVAQVIESVDLERPGDYLVPKDEDEESKKKTYMIKDPLGKTQLKDRP